jgi:hypothetical protein
VNGEIIPDVHAIHIRGLHKVLKEKQDRKAAKRLAANQEKLKKRRTEDRDRKKRGK